MKLIKNTRTDRVIDVLRQTAQSGASLDIASPALSLFAFFELREQLNLVSSSRLILPLDADGDLTLLGSAADRAARNRLQARWLAKECAKWIREKTEVRASSSLLPQSAYFIRHLDTALSRVITGNCALTTDGLGLAPGNQLGLIQCAETPEEVMLFANWYESLWNAMPSSVKAKEQLLEQIQAMGDHHAPSLIYYQYQELPRTHWTGGWCRSQAFVQYRILRPLSYLLAQHDVSAPQAGKESAQGGRRDFDQY